MLSRLHARPVLTVGVCTAAAIITTSCSSSKHATSSASSPSTSTSASVTASATSGAGGAGGTAADATTTAAVTSTFVTLFNGSAPITQRLALLQNQSAFASALAAEASSPLITQTSATVSKVSLVNAKQANVTYTLALSGVPALKDQVGIAILDGSTWKVAAATFCALLTGAGQALPACTQASVTAIPS
jgi:hypothetical protein